MTQDIHQFLASYENAVTHFNVDAITPHFHEEFSISTANELWHFFNNDAFRKQLQSKLDNYKKLGATECNMQDKKIIHSGFNYHIVEVKWKLAGDKGIINCFSITYFIKLINDSWKHVFAIDHEQKSNFSSVTK